MLDRNLAQMQILAAPDHPLQLAPLRGLEWPAGPGAAADPGLPLLPATAGAAAPPWPKPTGRGAAADPGRPRSPAAAGAAARPGLAGHGRKRKVQLQTLIDLIRHWLASLAIRRSEVMDAADRSYQAASW